VGAVSLRRWMRKHLSLRKIRQTVAVIHRAAPDAPFMGSVDSILRALGGGDEETRRIVREELAKLRR